MSGGSTAAISSQERAGGADRSKPPLKYAKAEIAITIVVGAIFTALAIWGSYGGFANAAATTGKFAPLYSGVPVILLEAASFLGGFALLGVIIYASATECFHKRRQQTQ